MALLSELPQQYYNKDGSRKNFTNYQFVSLKDIINQFMLVYVGEDKIISKAKRLDVAFHAQRALAELSFDTLKSFKAQEITVPASLQMVLPQDYVNYTKISTVDSAGIKHLLYPTSKTSNPSENPLQDSEGLFKLQAIGTLDSLSSKIELDAEYKDILVGMQVTGSYIPGSTFIAATENELGITTITIRNSVGVANFPSQSNAGTTLNFEKADGALLLPQKESYIVENLSWNITDNKITGTASELTNIKVGMIVSHELFNPKTRVTNVFSNTIVVNLLPTNSVASGGEITFVSEDLKDSDTWANYKSQTPSENNNDDYEDDTYWPINGERYGLDPQHAQANGSFYMDHVAGKIHFSSNISGKTVILDYISDGLGTDDEMHIHKFAEEAMYRSILYSIASGRMQTQQLVPRLKKEKFAAIRTAKLRLSNLKLEELTQILRGKSKQIKH
tara:strand:+ start:613 stop:1953 length:1341 start_codon:yes stop_codon:yes gene_type:complete